MRIMTIIALSLALAACGSKAKPTAEPTPVVGGDTCGVDASGGIPATAEQCECLGLHVVGDIGNGQVACPDGETEIAKISYGIEGGVCCKAPGEPPAAP